MSQSTKILVAVIITALIVGGGIYFWQQQSLPNSDKQNQQMVSENEKLWEGKNFSFVYPSEYTADSNGLWTADGYKLHMNPQPQCSVCHIPYYEIKADFTSKSLDQYIIDAFGLTGSTLDEATSYPSTSYQKITIGDNNFVKITVSDMHDVTGYYTKQKDQVVAFRVYWNDRDTSKLQSIISTLKFE